MKPNIEQKKGILLEAVDIRVSFHHIEALKGVSVSIHGGEILSIVGDNGAGKSTLIKTLTGNIKPTSGIIRINGTTYKALTPRQAIKEGISAVYQDLSLGNTMSAADNLFLGNEKTKFGFLRKKEMNIAAEKLLRDLDIYLPDVRECVGEMSGGQRQGIAVARLVQQGGKVLIFDEPTAAMGLNESKKVESLIQKLASQEFAIILISHNLPQVFSLSDRICVMRQGTVVKELNTGETSMDEVVSLITGSRR